MEGKATPTFSISVGIMEYDRILLRALPIISILQRFTLWLTSQGASTTYTLIKLFGDGFCFSISFYGVFPSCLVSRVVPCLLACGHYCEMELPGTGDPKRCFMKKRGMRPEFEERC